jgi:hypothetical protein
LGDGSNKWKQGNEEKDDAHWDEDELRDDEAARFVERFPRGDSDSLCL